MLVTLGKVSVTSKDKRFSQSWTFLLTFQVLLTYLCNFKSTVNPFWLKTCMIMLVTVGKVSVTSKDKNFPHSWTFLPTFRVLSTYLCNFNNVVCHMVENTM